MFSTLCTSLAPLKSLQQFIKYILKVRYLKNKIKNPLKCWSGPTCQACVWEKVLQLFLMVSFALHRIENKTPVPGWRTSPVQTLPSAIPGLPTAALPTCGELLDSVLSGDLSQTAVFNSSQQSGSIWKSSGYSCKAPGGSHLKGASGSSLR